jgi:hypothetical protein
VDVGIVAERGRHDLRMRIGHHARHVAAHALELFRLAAAHARRRACASACRAGQSGALGFAAWCLRARGRRAGVRAGAAAWCRALARLQPRPFTSFIVTTPSAPLARTLRQIDAELLRQRAHGRHGLDAADAASPVRRRTRSLACMAPTTVPASASASVGATQPMVSEGARVAPAGRRVVMPGRSGLGALRQARDRSRNRPARAGGDHVAGASGQLAPLARYGDGTSTTALAVSIDTSGSSSADRAPSA